MNVEPLNWYFFTTGNRKNPTFSATVQLLYYRYTPEYIYHRFNSFFASLLSPSQNQRVFFNQQHYHRTRAMILQTTSAINHRDNRENAKIQALSSTKPMKNQSINAHESDQNNNCYELIIHSRYERRFKNTAKFIHQLWQTNILSSQIIEDKLIISSSLNATLQKQMRQKPFTTKIHEEKKVHILQHKENENKNLRARNLYRNEYETHERKTTHETLENPTSYDFS